MPISAPRLPGGATPTSQASAPAQENALPNPWTSRATESIKSLLANAKPRVATTVTVIPESTASFGPKRDAASPPGIAAASTPAP